MPTSDKPSNDFTRLDLVDPDPWAIAGVVIATISCCAQIAQAYAAFGPLNRGHTRSPIDDTFTTMLGRGLSDGSRNLSRLIKLLSRQNDKQRDVLEHPFRFGSVNMMLSRPDFDAYQQISGQLITNLLEVQSASLGILKHDPELSDRLGLNILEYFRDLPEIINGFYLDNQTYGQVLDRCLDMLRVFERILGRLTDGN